MKFTDAPIAQQHFRNERNRLAEVIMLAWLNSETSREYVNQNPITFIGSAMALATEFQRQAAKDNPHA